MLLHRSLVKSSGFALLDSYSVLRTFPDAGAEPVAVDLAHQLCLPVDKLYRPFGACAYAETAAIAFILVFILNCKATSSLLFLSLRHENLRETYISGIIPPIVLKSQVFIKVLLTMDFLSK